MKADKRAEKRKRQRENKKKKLADKKADFIWRCAIAIVIVIVGSVVGMLLPFIFTRLKLDPATASAPLITTICDISGVLIYFTMAKVYFGL